jgi:hypothetical protein
MPTATINPHAQAFVTWIDAGNHVLPDGSLMRPHEIGLRLLKPASLVRYWIQTHRPDVWAALLEQRIHGSARRLRKVFASVADATELPPLTTK